MKGSHLPSEGLMVFPVVGVAEMTVPYNAFCSRNLRLSGFEYNLRGLSLISPRDTAIYKQLPPPTW